MSSLNRAWFVVRDSWLVMFFTNHAPRATRHALIAALLLSATACGFEPLYAGKQGGGVTTASSLAGVQINVPDDRYGKQLRNDMQDRLNPGGLVEADSLYRIDIEMLISETPIGIARDGTISRYNVYLISPYKLRRVSDGGIVHVGNIRRVSSYSLITNAYFSTHVSRDDAIARGVTELAEEYRQLLAAYLTRNPDPSKLRVQSPEDLKNNPPPPQLIDPADNQRVFDEINRQNIR